MFDIGARITSAVGDRLMSRVARREQRRREHSRLRQLYESRFEAVLNDQLPEANAYTEQADWKRLMEMIEAGEPS